MSELKAFESKLARYKGAAAPTLYSLTLFMVVSMVVNYMAPMWNAIATQNQERANWYTIQTKKIAADTGIDEPTGRQWLQCAHLVNDTGITFYFEPYAETLRVTWQEAESDVGSQFTFPVDPNLIRNKRFIEKAMFGKSWRRGKRLRFELAQTNADGTGTALVRAKVIRVP